MKKIFLSYIERVEELKSKADEQNWEGWNDE